MSWCHCLRRPAKGPAKPVPKMVSCERVDVSFTETAPYRFCNRVDLGITPEQLFEVLADAESWPHWASVITKVTWTSPEPRGVGTTRTFDMRGGIVGEEEFLVWEPFTRTAFRFNGCSSKAVAAFSLTALSSAATATLKASAPGMLAVQLVISQRMSL
jgi:hypothetical protein